MEHYIGSFEAAKLCQVSPGTVIRWIKEGKLQASVTAGGHHRILAKDLTVFMKNLRMAIPARISSWDNLRILIVDDEAPVRDLIRWILTRNFLNISIQEAGEGFIAGWSASSFHPHLVILDLMIPGLDGFQICEFIRQSPELQDIKIIAISALADARGRILKAGANEFLSKPFDPEELQKAVCRLLNIESSDVKGDQPDAA